MPGSPRRGIPRVGIVPATRFRRATMNRRLPASDAPARDGVRLDLWLWSARFFKTRALAKSAIEGGKLRVNGTLPKSARLVHVGDRLRIMRGEECFEVDVVALARVRGPAKIAQGLYVETAEGRTQRESAAAQRRLAASGYERPPTKPDKRARRLIRALGDIDAS